MSEQTRTYYKDKTDKAPVIDVVRSVSISVCNLLSVYGLVSSSVAYLPSACCNVFFIGLSEDLCCSVVNMNLLAHLETDDVSMLSV